VFFSSIRTYVASIRNTCILAEFLFPAVVSCPAAEKSWVKCPAAVACAESVWSLACDRGSSVFVFVRCLPAGLYYKCVAVIAIVVVAAPRHCCLFFMSVDEAARMVLFVNLLGLLS
jgi:hypothetical protein